MEERDARTLSQDAQEEVRRQAIRMLKNGTTRTEVARILGVSRQHVGEWWKRYHKGGMSALKKRKRGLPKGLNRKLRAEQELEIQQTLIDKTPDQLKMKFALWTREAVRELIEQRYGVRSAVKPEAHNRRSYAPKGQTPVIRQPAKRFHSSFISAISKRGKLHWMGLNKPLDADLFIEFLKRLIKNRKKKVFLIVDNLKVHHGKLVKKWVEKNKKRIELFYLPSYSPELNPDEYLNQGLKKVIFRNGIAKDKRELDAKLEVSLFMFEIRPKAIQSFFRGVS